MSDTPETGPAIPAPTIPTARYGMQDPITGEWKALDVVPLHGPSLLVLRDDSDGISAMALGIGLQQLVDHLKPLAVGAVHLLPSQEITAISDEEMLRIGYRRIVDDTPIRG